MRKTRNYLLFCKRKRETISVFGRSGDNSDVSHAGLESISRLATNPLDVTRKTGIGLH